MSDKLKEIGSNGPLQTYYELGFAIKTPYAPPKLREGCRWDEDTSFCDKICVSEAHTHAEMLVFPAWWFWNSKGERVLGHDMMNISGQHTMMIAGGDPSTFRKPEVYARHIRMKYGKAQKEQGL